MDITNYRLIPLWKAFETCSEEAEKGLMSELLEAM
jgi:glutamate formiminotransferase